MNIQDRIQERKKQILEEKNKLHAQRREETNKGIIYRLQKEENYNERCLKDATILYSEDNRYY